ncbi:ubiquinol-cytochrome c reductase iron-sulfur subunit [uncultured Paludibaculum sp.]|uniref:QcrA and Rieske domain-containing protein n=1 Tax=uncultured Paludibaculum sp. TaxID=1765020 RepID=UPI002AABBE5F|nr:ubiquinol-cytochrome c reductase iron-sulfur subunit [uncultured Paludibaculum sp.]
MSNGKDRCPREEGLWREEFSVSSSEQSYVERRQFGKFLVLTSGAMFAGQIWLMAKDWMSKAQAIVWPRKEVAAEGDLAIGAAKVFQYPGPNDNCLLVRISEAKYVAYSQKCTHLSCAVIYSEEKNVLECPCHNGSFSIDDGHVIQGPPPRPLPRVNLESNGGKLIATGMSVFGEGD